MTNVMPWYHDDQQNVYQMQSWQPDKAADIWQRHHLFPYEMESEEREQKFYTDDTSLANSGRFFWGVI